MEYIIGLVILAGIAYWAVKRNSKVQPTVVEEAAPYKVDAPAAPVETVQPVAPVAEVKPVEAAPTKPRAKKPAAIKAAPKAPAKKEAAPAAKSKKPKSLKIAK